MAESPEMQKPIILEWSEQLGNAQKFALKPISGAEAFRKYGILTGPVKNASGNLRGMVINAKARQIYRIVEQAEKPLKKIEVLAILWEVGSEYSRAKAIVQSDRSSAEKASRIMVLGGAAILRAVTSIVPATFHILALSAEGYGHLYSEITGSSAGNAFADRTKAADIFVTETHRKQWNGELWYDVATARIGNLISAVVN